MAAHIRASSSPSPHRGLEIFERNSTCGRRPAGPSGWRESLGRGEVSVCSLNRNPDLNPSSPSPHWGEGWGEVSVSGLNLNPATTDHLLNLLGRCCRRAD